MKYANRMEILHRAGKEHLNADALSRLATVDDPETNVFVVQTNAEETPVQRIHLFNIGKELESKIVKALPEDRQFRTSYNLMVKKVKETKKNEDGPVVTREMFRIDMDTKLLYKMEKDGKNRLCIPAKQQGTILKMAHDHHAHQGVNRVLERLLDVCYFPKMRQTVKSYVSGCPECQVSKPSRKLSTGVLTPLQPPTQPHQVRCLDFVVALPETLRQHDAILTVTDGFSKFLYAVPGTTDWSAIDWAETYFEQVHHITGIPAALVSDRDPKFTSKFWQGLCSRLKVKLNMTTAYHPQANGQSE